MKSMENNLEHNEIAVKEANEERRQKSEESKQDIPLVNENAKRGVEIV
jgi:hypothetical protein